MLTTLYQRINKYHIWLHNNALETYQKLEEVKNGHKTATMDHFLQKDFISVDLFGIQSQWPISWALASSVDTVCTQNPHNLLGGRRTCPVQHSAQIITKCLEYSQLFIAKRAWTLHSPLILYCHYYIFHSCTNSQYGGFLALQLRY